MRRRWLAPAPRNRILRAMSRPTAPNLPSRSAPTTRILLVLALVGTFAGACASEEDRAAKARIFSPEEPLRHVVLAGETIDVSRAAADRQGWERIVGMTRLESLERIGPHRGEGEVRFTWSKGRRRVALTEEYRFAIDAAGDFRAQIMNDEDEGLEFVWADGQAFARSRYGQFRPRRIDRAQQDRWRDEGSGALRSVVGLFDGRLQVKAAGEIEVGGRRAIRFTPSIGAAPSTKTQRKLPPPVYGLARVEGESELQPGPDLDTGRRLEFDARKEPVRVDGEILVDRDTAVVLAAKLDAQFRVPGATEEEAAELHLVLDWKVNPDRAVTVGRPEKAEPSRTVHAVNDPLWFLDGDSPVKKPAPAAEPPDEATDD